MSREGPSESCAERLGEHLSSHPEILEEMMRRRRLLKPLFRELEVLLAKPEPRDSEDEARIQDLERRIKEGSYMDINLGDFEAKAATGPKSQPATRVGNPFLEPDRFLRYSQVSGDSFATGATRMPSTWSRSFVHGSDSLIPVVQLAGQILRPSETIEGLGAVNWRKPMTSDLQVAVMRGAVPRDPKSVMDGTLRTTEGELSFMARLIEEPIPGVLQPRNPYSTIYSNPGPVAKSRNGFYQFTLMPPSVSGWELALQDPALMTATMAELVTEAVDRVDFPSRRDAVLRLMGGLSDLSLPKNPEALFRGSLKVRVDSDALRTGKSGMTIVPFQYALPHQNVPSRGFAALTDRFETSDCVVGR